ncbi:Fe-binding Fe/S cluster assembly protein ISA1 [Sporobolomyces koalae]|uniref:Fe-binding Fe/S cluster assembly protein ISA1 n=1 Tax=Sporobolomyces koalae TaxID=500713 RepID=UPI0031758E55
MSFARPVSQLRLASRALERCPACCSLAARHSSRSIIMSPIPSTSRLFTSYSTPRRAPILDQTLARMPPPVAVAPPSPSTAAKPKRVIRARKAAVSLTPTAVTRIRALLDSPEPKLIRVGVRNKGCAGMSYHLDYVDKPDKFDEVVEQDGVRVVIDSKALFSIIGSEMDWQEDALQARFVFKNPNIKDACGCGESFIV